MNKVGAEDMYRVQSSWLNVQYHGAPLPRQGLARTVEQASVDSSQLWHTCHVHGSYSRRACMHLGKHARRATYSEEGLAENSQMAAGRC